MAADGALPSFEPGTSVFANGRGLCWALAAHALRRWTIHYVSTARASVHAPAHLPAWIHTEGAQRRRAFFATLYAVRHTARYVQTTHTAGRKLVLVLGNVYAFFVLVCRWFAPAHLYLFFRVLTRGMEAPAFQLPWAHTLNDALNMVYIGTLFSCFLLSLGSRPHGRAWKYWVVVVVFGCLGVYMLVAGVVCMAKTDDRALVRVWVGLVATYAVYIFASLMALDPWHLLTSSVQYLFFAPARINLLTTYAFCFPDERAATTMIANARPRTLDAAVARGDGTVDVVLPCMPADMDPLYDAALGRLRNQHAPLHEVRPPGHDHRTNLLLVWSLTNALLAALLLPADLSHTFDGHGAGRIRIYLLVVLITVAVTNTVRFVGSSLYRFIRFVDGG